MPLISRLARPFSLAVLAAACTLTPAVYAQPFGGGRGGSGGPGGFGGFNPENAGLQESDLDAWIDILSLDPEQAGIAREMFLTYRADLTAATAELQTAMQELREEMRESRDPATFEKMRELGTSLQTKAQSLRATLMDDLQLVLTEDQAEQWPAIERRERRSRGMTAGFIAGTAVDIIDAYAEIKQNEDFTEQLNAVDTDDLLERYEIEVDKLLIQREAANGDFSNFRDMDPDDRMEMLEDRRDMEIKLRDLNRRYARDLAAIIGDAPGEALMEEVNRRTVPAIYREGRTQRTLAAALALPDLTEAQSDRLSDLSVRVNAELAKLRTRYVEAQLTADAERSIEDMFRGRGRGGQGDEGSDLQKTREAMQELAERTNTELRAVLTDAQLEAATPAQEERQFRGGDNNRTRQGDRQGGRQGDRQGGRGSDA